MADGGSNATALTAENQALQEALAAEHTAVWGYGVVGAALGTAAAPASTAEAAHRDLRDQVAELLDSRKADPAPAKAGYALPFPILSGHDAATLAVRLEEGVSRAWVRLLDQAAGTTTRTLALDALSAAELRAVSWRVTAGQTPVTSAFPGLPTT